MFPDTPKVSVLMPAFNGGRFIRASIDSILGQSFEDFELIVINDGSTDDTAEVVGSFSDPRIRLLHNEVNAGLSRTRNRCIREARGAFLAWLDCDDLAAPNRLEKQIRFLERHSAYGMVGTWVAMIDQNGRPTGRRLIFNAPSRLIPSLMLFRCAFQQSALTMRRSLLATEPHYDEAYPPVEDFEFFGRLVRRAPGWNLPEVLCSYRQHEANISLRAAATAIVGVRRVLERQLKELGLEATEEESNMHMALGNMEARRDVDPDVAHDWLRRLLAANREKRIYRPDAFAYVITERWLYLCWGMPGTLRERAHRFLRSPLLREAGLPWRVWVELLIRNASKRWHSGAVKAGWGTAFIPQRYEVD